MQAHPRTLALLVLIILSGLTIIPYAHGSGPDYQLSATPSALNIQQGYNNSTSIDVTSINNFTGTLSFSTSGLTTGLAVSWSANFVTPPPNGTVTVTFRFYASSTAPLSTSPVQIHAHNSTIDHYVTVYVTVVPPHPPGISVSTNPSTISLIPGESKNSTVTVMSVNGFNGTLTLTAEVIPTGLNVAFDPSMVPVTPTSQGSSTLMVSMPADVAIRSYSITIYASNGTLTNSGTIIINPPSQSPLESSTVQWALIAVGIGSLCVASILVIRKRRRPMDQVPQK